MVGSITPEQNSTAAEACMEAVNGRFGGSGIEVTVERHSNAKKYAFVRIVCPPQHWIALAKWMKYDLGVNYCSMVTGTHFPEGSPERGWEVAYHFLRQPVQDQKPNTCTVHDVEALTGIDVPMEIEVFMPLPQQQDLVYSAGYWWALSLERHWLHHSRSPSSRLTIWKVTHYPLNSNKKLSFHIFCF